MCGLTARTKVLGTFGGEQCQSNALVWFGVIIGLGWAAALGNVATSRIPAVGQWALAAISTTCGLVVSGWLATAATTQFVVAGIYAENAAGMSDEARATVLRDGHWLAMKLATGALTGGLLPASISVALLVRRRRPLRSG